MPIEHESYPFNPLTPDSIGDCIKIDATTHDIEVPRVDSALAKLVVVSEDNPWYTTDGVCLFSKDGTALIRCLAAVEHYDVPATCTHIEQEAFAYNTVLRSITFSDSLVHIGARAFISSAIDEIHVPGSVKTIGDEAFAEGKNLACATLDEGVELIGYKAFGECEKLAAITIPASVCELGKDAFVRCVARAHGEGHGLTISPDNGRFFADSKGVLYSREQDGLSLICALDKIVGSYEVLPGTTRILGKAFAFNRRLTDIAFPDSLEVIGKGAFLECDHLTRADLPCSLRELGAEAFYHTALREMHLPATLVELGPASLIVNIMIANQSPQTGVGGRGASDFYHTALSGKLHEVTVPRFNVTVADDNPRYTVDEGFLCEHDPETGELRAVQFVGGMTSVTIPRDVTQIAEYALFGVENVRELHLHTGIRHIGHSALALSYPIDLIEIDDGEEVPLRLYPAPNSSGTMAQRRAFRTGWLDLEKLVRDCDASLTFMMPGHERSALMLARLVNNRRLSEQFELVFTSTVRISTDELIRRFARLEDRQGILDLLDLGFIDGSSIAHAIEVANSVNGVACTRLLLEEKRARYSNQAFDFDL
ncbi:MAG: leucine-rich repeat protein [Eggerthellaceae bacterium]|nr:leucine-rich repeat protein [Eggerthellaceae bacterium]